MSIGTCVGELEPYRDVDADIRPMVWCMSGMRDVTPTTAHYTMCSDEHTYGISCEARHCSCMRDEVLVQTVDIEESQTIPGAMRYDCGFDTPR